MDWIYRGFETSLMGLCLGLVALVALGIQAEPAATLAIELPMLSVTTAAVAAE